MRPDSSIRWNAYPALLLAGSFALGIVSAAETVDLTVQTWMLVTLGNAALAALVLYWPRRRLVTLGPLWITLALGFMALALGGARTTAYQQTRPGDLGHLLPLRADMDGVLLAGRIVSAVEETAQSGRFTMRVDTLVHAADTLAVRGRARIFLRPSQWKPAAPFPTVRQGDRLRLQGRVQAPPPPRNPADFDYGAYLQRRRIHAMMTVRAPADVIVTERGAGRISRVVAAARTHIGRQIHRYVTAAESQAVLRALLLGDRSQITDTTRDRFVATGLLHLLAISGLHVLLVGMVVYTLLRPLLMRFRLRWRHVELARTLFTLVLLVGFAVLTGGRPSVVRAVVMAGLLIGGNVLQRTSHALNTLGVAALALLVMHPTMLFDAGFQLSFAAVGAIVTLNPRVQDTLPPRWCQDGWRSQLASLVTVSLTATLGTMPVLLVHFGYVSFAGLVLNVPAIPITALALISGLLVTFTGGWLPVAPLFGAAAELLIQALLATASMGETWLGWAAINWFVRDPWIILMLVTGLFIVAQWPRPRLRWRLVAVAGLFGLVSVWTDTLAHRSPPTLDVLFFDVGQGDAALVTLPNGRHILVDAGPRSPYFDAGASVILPHLERDGIERLDAVIISHSDSDHLGGLPTLLRNVSVGRVILSRQEANTELVAETETLLDSLSLSQEYVHVGDTLLVDLSTYIQVLAPPAESAMFGSDNNASVVLRVTYGETHFLFTGDIERQAEMWLGRFFNHYLESDVVKVSHHGSSTSSTSDFIRRVQPDSTLAVVSVGRHNSFGLPDPLVLERWKMHRATVLTTAEEGAILIRSDGTHVERIEWQ